MFIRKDTEHIQTIMLAAQGEPVTGVSPEQVRCYVSRNGGVPELFVLDSSNFKELGSAMMPGLYAVTFPAHLASVAGEFIAIFRDDTGTDLFDQYATKYTIFETLFDDIYEEVERSGAAIEQALDGTEVSLSNKIDNAKSSITNEITEGTQDVLAELDGVANKIDSIDLDLTPVTDAVGALQQDFDARVPEEAALKRHLVGMGGTEDAPPQKGLWDALDEVSTDLAGLSSVLGDVQDMARRILGLSHENFTITQQRYNTKNHLTEAVMTLYPSASDVEAGTNAFASYRISATYDAQDRLIHYEMKREG